MSISVLVTVAGTQSGIIPLTVNEKSVSVNDYCVIVL